MNSHSVIANQNKKRFLFVINTAGQAYTWQPLIKNFLDKGYVIKIIARNQGHTLNILQSFGLPYETFKPTGSGYTRLLGALKHFQNIYKLSKDFHPTLVIGFGADASITALRLRKPCVVFTDGDGTPLQAHLAGWLSNAVVTPQVFSRNLGRKHIRVPSYKELFYLHPHYFRPDPSIYDELKIKPGEKYVIVRFNSFSAVHDIGDHGFLDEDKCDLVKKLQKHARVFIAAEGDLPGDLANYKIPIQPNRIHHALYYAQMVVSDSGTMTVEATVLGTPGIVCNTNAHQYSNYTELSQKYNMMYVYHEPPKAIAKALELISQPDLKEQWNKKRQKLLLDKRDITEFMIDLVDNYPESLKRLKHN